MNKIGEIIGKKTKGDIGLEIECEGVGMSIVDTGLWKTTEDRSLRGSFPEEAAEFVLKKPVPLNMVENVVNGLVEALPDAEFNFSFRTSVHVHVNYIEHTVKAVAISAYTYFLLEEVLFEIYGPSRKNNRFCLRYQDAEGQYEALHRMLANSVFELSPDHFKYSAMNLCPLNQYGSVEYRLMSGNMDAKHIASLCHILVKIRDFAANASSCNSVLELLNNEGAKGFLVKVLGNELAGIIVENQPDYARMISHSASLTIDIPGMVDKYTAKKPEVVAENDVIINNLGVFDVIGRPLTPPGKVAIAYKNKLKSIENPEAVMNAILASKGKIFFEIYDPWALIPQNYRAMINTANIRMPRAANPIVFDDFFMAEPNDRA